MRNLLVALASAALPLVAMAADNELTPDEREAGWRLLFDGTTTSGWMSPKGAALPQSHVQDGALNPHPCDYMLVWGEPLADYELVLDFKLSPRCNSGIFVRTFPLEPRPGRDVGFNGLEVALDDTTTAGLHDTGAIYDLVAPRQNRMKPAGEWNNARIVSRGGRLEVSINGEAVSAIDLEAWTEPNRRPDGTAHKFDVAWRDHPRTGYVGLQDHGADCWFRNIKLRALPAAADGAAPGGEGGQR